MLPAFVKTLSLKLAAVLALLVLIAALLALPARPALLPMWPTPVDEIVTLAGDGGTCRELVRARGKPSSACGRLLARDRPVSVLCVERVSGDARCGFLLGVRETPDDVLADDIPEQLQEPVIDVARIGSLLIEMSAPPDGRFRFATEELRQAYRPNRLRLRDRLAIAYDRLLDALTVRLFDEAVTESRVSVPDTGITQDTPLAR